MSYDNYHDVIAQMEALGLDLEGKALEYNKRVRTKVQGRNGKQGWYKVYDDFSFIDAAGVRVTLLTGAYGYFQGGERVVEKIKLNRDDIPKLTAEQRAENKKRQAEAERIAKAEGVLRQKKAAMQAQWVWHRADRRGLSDYEKAKLIDGKDVRYIPDDIMSNGPFPGEIFNDPDLFDDPDLKMPPPKSVVIPMQDVDGNIHGLSMVLDKATQAERIKKRDGNNKENWPKGHAKQGHFYPIGPMITFVALLCEGWATGESLHAATGLPVIVCFDAYNIAAVLAHLLQYYPGAQFIICADDDVLWACRHCEGKINLNKIDDLCPHCGQPHKRENVGVKSAMKACTESRVNWVRPKFPDEDERTAIYEKNKGKLTDFNDLHVVASLSAVRKQIEGVLRQHNIGGTGAVVANKGGGGEDDDGENYRIESAAVAIERYSLIYAQRGTVFDHKFKILMSKDDMRDVCTRATMDAWQHSPHRRTYRVEQVGFDPTEQDETITCNLWRGWPTEPNEGDCSAILELLEYLCSGEDNAQELYQWLLKWFAYPIQNPGAKMATALVIHGGQGTGKNLMAEAVMKVYGEFGKVIDQDCLEDKYNDFFSKKLFLIADEVIGRSDRYHVVNKLKGLITGEKIRINPKNVASYDERNNINVVFLANGFLPVVIEQDDRRHCVVYVPEKREKEFYIKVKRQINNGGIAALHHHLLHNVDLTGFTEHTPVPATQAKTDLINLNKEAFPQFWEEYLAGEIGGVPLVPFIADDIWELFKAWCHKNGERPGKRKYLIAALGKMPGLDKQERQWVTLDERVQRTIYYPPRHREIPPGGQYEPFHNRCIDDFREAMAKYRGKNYD